MQYVYLVFNSSRGLCFALLHMHSRVTSPACFFFFFLLCAVSFILAGSPTAVFCVSLVAGLSLYRTKGVCMVSTAVFPYSLLETMNPPLRGNSLHRGNNLHPPTQGRPPRFPFQKRSILDIYPKPPLFILYFQAAACIQAAARGRSERQNFLLSRNAASVLQMWYRGRLQRNWYLALIGQVRGFFEVWKHADCSRSSPPPPPPLRRFCV